jgi:hypothetical protein
MASMNALSKGSLFASSWGVRHPHHLHLTGANLRGHPRGPEFLVLDGLQLFYFDLLGGDDVLGEVANLLVLGVLQRHLGHLDSPGGGGPLRL